MRHCCRYTSLNSQEKLQAARERLGFDEIFYLQMGVLRQKRDWKSAEAKRFPVPDEWLGARISSLPFTLTNVQQKAIRDIRADFNFGTPMNRLLQGDVGSGKTVVAALAAAMIVQAGSQAAIMSPTSILAEQHYRNFTRLLAGENGVQQEEQIRLLVGDTPRQKRVDPALAWRMARFEIVIGTHALIEDPVIFQMLLVVIDEQHRFGVEQRAALRTKGSNPHLLVMTATPIPRSLALTLYGDLDLSVMDEMPAGRIPVNTYVLRPQEREPGFYAAARPGQGRQAGVHHLSAR